MKSVTAKAGKFLNDRTSVVRLEPRRSLMANKVHRLKTWPEYYQAVAIGKKTFELRKNDRDFQVEDILILQEYDPATESLSGRELMRVVTYIMPGGKFGLDPDYVILGIA